MPEISHIITEVKNDFDKLSRRPDTTEERISKRVSKSEKQREQRLKKKNEQHIQEFRTTIKDITYV